MKTATTIAIPKKLAGRIDKMGDIIGNPSRTQVAQFLLRNALDIAEKRGIDHLIAAKNNEQGHKNCDNNS